MNKNSKFVPNAVFLMVACVLSPNIFAGMYKWVDEEGNVQYTQTPPPAGIEAETIKPPPKVDTGAALKELEAQQEKAAELRESRLEQAEKEAQARQELELRKKNCELAKARLASYERPMVKFVQEDGTRVRATEEERQAEIVKSQEMIKEWCD